VPIRVLSVFRHESDPARTGTLITRREKPMEGLLLTGLASERGFARIVLRGVPPGMAAMTSILGRLADAGVSVDMVAHADRADGRRQVQMTVRESVLEEALALCEALAAELDAGDVEASGGLCRIALVGSGMTDMPGVYATAFRALNAADVEVFALSTSAISIALVVAADREERSLQALHAAFDLGEVQ
jgi:aspartate kinase